jgi:hypothetical protein
MKKFLKNEILPHIVLFSIKLFLKEHPLNQT